MVNTVEKSKSAYKKKGSYIFAVSNLTHLTEVPMEGIVLNVEDQVGHYWEDMGKVNADKLIHKLRDEAK